MAVAMALAVIIATGVALALLIAMGLVLIRFRRTLD
jgi:hypothetical protein